MLNYHTLRNIKLGFIILQYHKLQRQLGTYWAQIRLLAELHPFLETLHLFKLAQATLNLCFVPSHSILKISYITFL